MRENERVYQEEREEKYRNSLKDIADKMNDNDKCQVASNKGKVGENSIQNFLTMYFLYSLNKFLLQCRLEIEINENALSENIEMFVFFKLFLIFFQAFLDEKE